jgi:hypothetical protein
LAVLNHRISPEEKEKHPGGKSNDDTMYAVVSLHPNAAAPVSQAATEEMMSQPPPPPPPPPLSSQVPLVSSMYMPKQIEAPSEFV